MTAIAEKLKAALIQSEVARLNAADAETVSMILDSLSTVSDAGAVVSRDGAKPLADMIADMQRTNPAYFEAPKDSAPAVILDPTKPGFSLSRAFAEARNNPELHRELLARLAPRPMMPGATR